MNIPIPEKVPPDYIRLYLFYGENDFSSMILVDGSQEMICGSHGMPTEQTSRDVLDWQEEVVFKIRSELQLINLFPDIA